mgnify:FL=1
MKKRMLGLIIGACMLAGSSCFAMQFSSVEKIGEAGISQAGRSGGGMVIINATHNTGDYYITNAYNAHNTQSYGKGVATFGDGDDALYMHYNMYDHTPTVMGGKNIHNTIQWRFLIGYISRIRTDEGITLYAIQNTYGPEFDYVIIGRRTDGVWVKYLDTREITDRYWSKRKSGAPATAYRNLRTEGDTLVMDYRHWSDQENGEFRFRWDTNAQWFGIDKVVY